MTTEARPRRDAGRASSRYDEAFFASIREGSRRSAEALVPQLLERLGHCDRVVDVGCGEGWWGKAFEDASSVTGLDREQPEGCVLTDFREEDLTEPIIFPAHHYFDLAVCLEVAEHLPPERAEGFVADLCKLAPIVIFSAAVPGQGGTGHLNEQWPEYWRELFDEQGYQGTGALRWAIWEDERICWWYRQNLLVFFADTFDAPIGLPFDDCRAVVHPEMWKHHGRPAWRGQANL